MASALTNIVPCERAFFLSPSSRDHGSNLDEVIIYTINYEIELTYDLGTILHSPDRSWPEQRFQSISMGIYS